MGSKEFFEMAEKPEGSSSSSFFTVAKVEISMAFRGGYKRTSEYFSFSNSNDQSTARTKCQAYMDEIGENKWPSGDPKWPVIGVLTTLHGDDVPTSPSGKRWETMPENIWMEFIEKNHSDLTYANVFEPILSEEVRASVRGSMPYTATLIALKEVNADELFHQPTWCKLTQEVNQWEELNVKRGKIDPNTYADKDGNEKTSPYRFWVIRGVYANEAEAKADAEVIKAGNVQPQVANDGAQLSAEAIKTWKNLAALKKQEDNIIDTIENAMKGIGIPDNEKLSLADAQAYAAEGYGIKPEDLLLIGIGEEVPF